MPTPAQVRELPEVLRMRVPAEWEDMNGHVNVQHYTGMYDRAGSAMMAMLGIDEDWVRRGRVGLFDLEHHVWFIDEVHVGDEVTVHACFTARNAKRAQGVVFLLDETRGRLASALEFLSTAANLDTRRTVTWPEAVARHFDAEIGRVASLGWAVPSSGAISV
jgi:acyl-CoA thioesterase FadM